MKFIWILAICIMYTDCTKRVDIHKRMADIMSQNRASRMERRNTEDTEATPDEFLDMTTGEKLEHKDRILTSQGTLETKYEERYKGLPVLGESVVIETDFDGDYTGGVYGYLVDDIEEDIPSVKPDITPQEVLQIALTHHGVSEEVAKCDINSDIRLAVLIEQDGDKDIQATLIYTVTFTIKIGDFPKRPVYTINANNGDIIKISDQMESILHGSYRDKSRGNLNDILETEEMSKKEVKHNYKWNGVTAIRDDQKRDGGSKHFTTRKIGDSINYFKYLEMLWKNQTSEFDNIPNSIDQMDNKHSENIDQIIDFGELDNSEGPSQNNEIPDIFDGSYNVNLTGQITQNETPEPENSLNLSKPENSSDLDESKEFLYQTLGGNEKMGHVRYGDGIDAIPIPIVDRMCVLETDDFRLVNANFTENENENNTIMFNCSDGIHDEINGAYAPTADAFYNTIKTYEMFAKWYQMKAHHDKLIIYVHYGDKLDNAMAGGTELYLGDGYTMFYPLVTPAVIAHEIAHTITGTHSNLMYGEQSGGLNEAFSDMSAETAEFYIFGEVDWKLGYYIQKGDKSFRYFDDPAQDNGKSIKDATRYCPGMDVHYSSGLYNHIFYLLSNKPGWGIRDTYNVFLIANRLYWRQDSDFADAACGVLKAAKDAGMDPADAEAVFRSVNIEPCVSQKFGIAHMFDLCSSGETKYEFTWAVPPGIGDVVIESRGAQDFKGAVELVVKAKHGQWTAASGNTTNEVLLPYLPSGSLTATIRGDHNFTSVRLYAMSHIIQLPELSVESRANCNQSTGEDKQSVMTFQFELTEEILNITGSHATLGVRGRAHPGFDGWFSLAVRYAEPVNLDSYHADVWGTALADNTQEGLFCYPQLGTYYGTISSCRENVIGNVEVYWFMANTMTPVGKPEHKTTGNKTLETAVDMSHAQADVK